MKKGKCDVPHCDTNILALKCTEGLHKLVGNFAYEARLFSLHIVDVTVNGPVSCVAKTGN
jgi:hypothetical protein